ncbi:hypothetical protein F2Q68_00026769 [Brassica cretica]|uniref:Uncharacterized protein n=1 Tax=Brassica cretica TaxID=69181 RepID=A0A8S9I7G3_BRACR|nr:hypothetical protein F2Q68_00026769 [Brassica cretica]
MIVSHHTAGNYMKSKKANKKFNFKVFTETGPKTSLITDVTQQNDSELKNKGGKPTVRVSNVGHALHVRLNGEYNEDCRSSGTVATDGSGGEGGGSRVHAYEHRVEEEEKVEKVEEMEVEELVRMEMVVVVVEVVTAAAR